MYCKVFFMIIYIIYNAQLICILAGLHTFLHIRKWHISCICMYMCSHHVAMNLRTCFFPTGTQSVSSKHISRCTTCSHHHCKETTGNWDASLYGAVWSSNPTGNNLHLGEATRKLTNFVVRIFQDDPRWLPVFPGEHLESSTSCRLFGVWTLQFTFEANGIYRWTHGHISLDVATSAMSRLVLDICFWDDPFDTLHEMAHILKTVDWVSLFWLGSCFFLFKGGGVSVPDLWIA